MQLRFLWRSDGQQSKAGVRFRQLLTAARETEYYRDVTALREALRASKSELEARMPDLIGHFPIVDQQTLQRDSSHFRSSRRGPRARPRFFFPLKPAPQTAVFLEGLARENKVRHFQVEESAKLAAYRPEVLAGTVEQLLAAADLRIQGKCALPSLTRGIVVYTGVNLTTLDEAVREKLWQAFRVPVYEQFLGLGHELLAWECQAHDGLHIKPENGFLEIQGGGEQGFLLMTSFFSVDYPALRLHTKMLAYIDRKACPCGNESARLVTIPQQQVPGAPARATSEDELVSVEQPVAALAG